MQPRSRLLLLLVVSAALFGLLAFFDSNPLRFRGVDIREEVFGPKLRWLKFAAWVPLIFFIVRLIDRIAFDWGMSRRKHVSAPLLLREIVQIGLFLTLVAWAMTTILNVPVTGWLATGTVLAAVLGLALQETLGNLFAGIALHLEDSFEVGDVIRSGDFIGVVEAARWRGTRIRTFNNDIVILPNSVLARERLEVFPRTNLNARLLTVGVDYNIPPATVIRVLVDAMANIEGVSRDIPPLARVGAFGDSSVTYEMKYFTRDYSQRDRIDSEIRRAVWYALKRNEIPIPLPIRMVHRYSKPTRADHEVSHDDVVHSLEAVDILSPLSAEAHEAIAGAARVQFYAKGETIITRGASGSSMFIVRDGTVAVRVGDDEVARLGPGAVVGEMALLTGETRAADVVAVTDVHAIEIPKTGLASVLQEHPDLAKAISSKVLERRRRLDALRDDAHDDEERTMLSRIRDWFGLR